MYQVLDGVQFYAVFIVEALDYPILWILDLFLKIEKCPVQSPL